MLKSLMQSYFKNIKISLLLIFGASYLKALKAKKETDYTFKTVDGDPKLLHKITKSDIKNKIHPYCNIVLKRLKHLCIALDKIYPQEAELEVPKKFIQDNEQHIENITNIALSRSVLLLSRLITYSEIKKVFECLEGLIHRYIKEDQQKGSKMLYILNICKIILECTENIRFGKAYINGAILNHFNPINEIISSKIEYSVFFLDEDIPKIRCEEFENKSNLQYEESTNAIPKDHEHQDDTVKSEPSPVELDQVSETINLPNPDDRKKKLEQAVRAINNDSADHLSFFMQLNKKDLLDLTDAPELIEVLIKVKYLEIMEYMPQDLHEKLLKDIYLIWIYEQKVNCLYFFDIKMLIKAFSIELNTLGLKLPVIKRKRLFIEDFQHKILDAELTAKIRQFFIEQISELYSNLTENGYKEFDNYINDDDLACFWVRTRGPYALKECDEIIRECYERIQQSS